MWTYNHTDTLTHYGVLGMKWGKRRYQNKDGSLTPAGKRKLERSSSKMDRIATNRSKKLGISKEDYEERMSNTSMKRLRLKQAGSIAIGGLKGAGYYALSDAVIGANKNKSVKEALETANRGQIIVSGMLATAAAKSTVAGFVKGTSDRQYKRAQNFVKKYTDSN